MWPYHIHIFFFTFCVRRSFGRSVVVSYLIFGVDAAVCFFLSVPDFCGFSTSVRLHNYYSCVPLLLQHTRIAFTHDAMSLLFCLIYDISCKRFEGEENKERKKSVNVGGITINCPTVKFIFIQIIFRTNSIQAIKVRCVFAFITRDYWKRKSLC